jgi:hypothetical protein
MGYIDLVIYHVDMVVLDIDTGMGYGPNDMGHDNVDMVILDIKSHSGAGPLSGFR